MKKTGSSKVRPPTSRELITEVLERARVRHLRAAAEAAGQPIGPAEAKADKFFAPTREWLRRGLADRSLDGEEGKRLMLLGLVGELYDRTLGLYPNVTKAELIAVLHRVVPARRGPLALSPMPTEDRRLLRLALRAVLREKKHVGWGRRGALEHVAKELGSTPEGIRDLLK